MKNSNFFQNGLMSGAPFLCSYVSSVLFCYLADVLVNSKLLTLTNVRKLFTAMCKYHCVMLT